MRAKNVRIVVEGEDEYPMWVVNVPVYSQWSDGREWSQPLNQAIDEARNMIVETIWNDAANSLYPDRTVA